MSENEMRIREELEKEVEMGMEDELKDGIYKLALRLHHLYRSCCTGKKLCSELRINIRMEGGGAKIEFREIKREKAAGGGSSPTPRAINVGFVRAKKFDWIQTLRSEDGARNVALNGNNKKKKAFIC